MVISVYGNRNDLEIAAQVRLVSKLANPKTQSGNKIYQFGMTLNPRLSNLVEQFDSNLINLLFETAFGTNFFKFKLVGIQNSKFKL